MCRKLSFTILVVLGLFSSGNISVCFSSDEQKTRTSFHLSQQSTISALSQQRKRSPFLDKRKSSVSHTSTASILQCHSCTSDQNMMKQCKKAKQQCLSSTGFVSAPSSALNASKWAASEDVYCSGLWQLLMAPEEKICPQNVDMILVLANGYAKCIRSALKSVANRDATFSVTVNMFSKMSTRRETPLSRRKLPYGPSPTIYVYLENIYRRNAVHGAIVKAINEGRIQDENSVYINVYETKKSIRCERRPRSRKFNCFVKLIFYKGPLYVKRLLWH